MAEHPLVRGSLCCACVVLIVLVCLAGRAAATEGLNVSPDVPPVPVNQPGLLVLKSGRTIAGRISQSANGYTVDQVHGTIAVPFDLVEFFARDEREALRLFHKRTPNPTAGFHVRLAEWCLPYQLLAEARDELRAALLLEPHRGDARNLLRRLDALLEPPAPVEAALTVNPPWPLLSATATWLAASSAHTTSFASSPLRSPTAMPRGAKSRVSAVVA